MNKELTETLKYLHLGGLLARWDEYLKLAADKGFSHTRLLTYVLEEECRIKRENARRLRLKRARIPEPLVIETFPFERQPKLNKKKILALYDFRSGLERRAQSQPVAEPRPPLSLLRAAPFHYLERRSNSLCHGPYAQLISAEPAKFISAALSRLRVDRWRSCWCLSGCRPGHRRLTRRRGCI